MAHLRLYKGGTIGGQDGVEIPLDGTGVIDVYGLFPPLSSAYTSWMAVPLVLYLRCDAGYTVPNCTVTVSGNLYVAGIYNSYSYLNNGVSMGGSNTTTYSSTIGQTNVALVFSVKTTLGESGVYNDSSFSLSFTEVAG